MASTNPQASPADLRNGLDPTAVGVLADQLHALSCVTIGAHGSSAPAEHRDSDRAKARFILLGLRDAGWDMTVVTL